VTLRATGTRRPLWCIAGAGGVAAGFGPLARRLGEEQPVYALQAHGLENPGLPDWSVRAIAERHVRTLRAVQPVGPYRLAGHSLGGVVALEMAHRLRAEGDEVELLAILDSFPPDPSLAPAVLTGDVYARAKKLAAIVTTGLLGDRGLGHYLRFHQQGQLLQRRYRGAPWDGRSLVVVARDDPGAPARERWEAHLTGEWELCRVAGDHVGILHEPDVAGVAAALSAGLDRCEESPTTSAR
jgi:thioesterase domain-containing protein